MGFTKNHRRPLGHTHSPIQKQKTLQKPTSRAIKTREHLIGKIDKIRRARDEIFHNKPTQIKFQSDIENLLLRLGYNLQDAIDIGEIRNVIPLQYNYNNSKSTPSPE